MLESINRKLSTITAKMYKPFATKEAMEIIRDKVKEIDINEGIEIYKKAVKFSYQLKLMGILIIITMILFDFITLNFIDNQSLIFSMRPNIKIIMAVMVWITIYKIWKHKIYCYCYKEALKHKLKHTYDKENIHISVLE